MNDVNNIEMNNKNNSKHRVKKLLMSIILLVFLSLIIFLIFFINQSNDDLNIEKDNNNYEETKDSNILYKVHRENVPYNEITLHHTYSNEEMVITPLYESTINICHGSLCEHGFKCLFSYKRLENNKSVIHRVDSCFYTSTSNNVSLSLSIGGYSKGVKGSDWIFKLAGKFDENGKYLIIYDGDNWGYDKDLNEIEPNFTLINYLYKELLDKNIEYVLYDPKTKEVYDFDGLSILEHATSDPNSETGLEKVQLDISNYVVKEMENEKSDNLISDNKVKLAKDVDLNKQREKYNNQDIIGRVEFPGLFNELVLRGTDNNYYRVFNVEHQPYEKGSEPIFMDYRVNPQSRQINLYNMNKEVSSPKLSKYLDEKYFENNPYIIFQHDNGKSYYKIISIKNESSNNYPEYMNLDYTDESFISHMKKIISGYGLMYSRDIEIKDDSNFLVVQSNTNDSLIIIIAIEIDNIE